MEAWDFEGELFEYSGKGSWHFVTLPADVAFAIRCATKSSRSGWGMVPVTAEIADVAFRTSLFPEKASSSYLLPVKAAVRKSARLKAGDRIMVSIALLP